jgi:hypothetical protein
MLKIRIGFRSIRCVGLVDVGLVLDLTPWLRPAAPGADRNLEGVIVAAVVRPDWTFADVPLDCLSW